MSMSTWENRKLTELADYLNGYAFGSDDWGTEGVPIIRIEQLKNPNAPADYYSGKLPAKNIIDDGDLIFSWSASLFLRIWKHGRAALNQHLFKVVEKPGVYREFLKSFIEFYLPELTKASHGSTMQHITRKELERFSAWFPVCEIEQKSISSVVAAIDRAIEQTEALIAKQQRIKIGLMQDLLTKGIDERGNIRSETTHAFKDSPLGRIPVEWDVQELKSLLANVDPAMRSGPFGSALLKEELAEAGIPLLGIDNVFPEEFVSDYKRFVPPKKAEQLRRYLVRPRDLMITIMGTVGRCCVVPDDIGEALSSKHVWTISIDQTKYSPCVACFQINHSPWVLEHFAKDEQGGIMASIRAETLRTTRLPVPPRYELEQIESVLRSISADLVEKELLFEKLCSLKVGLMYDLITGDCRVTSLLAQVDAQ